MPDNVMQVDIVSPERILFSGQATMVVTRTLDGGEIAFLPNHAPFLAALTESHTRIYEEGGTVVNVAVHGGFVEVSNNKVSILSDVAELSDQIDVNRARPPVSAPRRPCGARRQSSTRRH
jgi:F-type H+-transporting ATPase subunit epsilon